MPYEPNPYSISHMTGCAEGRVPAISLPEAIESGEPVKAFDIESMSPLYGSVIAIDFALKTFDLDMGADKGAVITLSMKNYAIFKLQILSPSVPTKIGNSIICDEEIFTVVVEQETPVWVGDHGLTYYAEDIQALTQRYGYSILIG
jgi:hypothetical protein